MHSTFDKGVVKPVVKENVCVRISWADMINPPEIA